MIKIIGLHKLVEDIGTQYHCLRNCHPCIFELFKFGITLHHIINEGKATAFSSQRTVADTGKVGVTVETVTFEDGNHSLIFHLPVLHDRLEDNPAVCIYVLKTGPRDRLQKLGYRKHGTRIEPARNVIPADMIQEGLGRHGKQDILQLFQVPHTGNLFSGLRIAEHKVTEPEVIGNDAPQVNVHLFRILIDKAGTVFGGIRRVFRFGGLDNQRYERIVFAYGGTKLDTCQTVFLAPFHFRETDIGNDS